MGHFVAYYTFPGEFPTEERLRSEIASRVPNARITVPVPPGRLSFRDARGEVNVEALPTGGLFVSGDSFLLWEGVVRAVEALGGMTGSRG